MAIYHLNFSNGKVGKGLAHFNYITANEKYSYKENELLNEFHYMPKNISAEDFWRTADAEERDNGRVYKEIRLSLPQEFTIEENSLLLQKFIQQEIGNKHYYSAVIHDKDASNKIDKNVHAHIMLCPREIDGIDRNLDNFFKRYNPKNPYKGGAKKSDYWNKRETLLHFRTAWEKILNKELEKKGINRVSSKSLLEQKIEALKKGDTELAKTLDRDAIGIKESLSYVLYRDKENLQDFELLELENYELNKKMRDALLYLNELLKMRDLEISQKEEKAKELKDLYQEIIIENKELLADKKQDLMFANIFDIQENILMLNCEKVFIENKYKDVENNSDENQKNQFFNENSDLKLVKINAQIEDQNKLLNQELLKLKDNNQSENIGELFVEKTFKKDFLELTKTQFDINRFEKQITKIETQLENPKEVVANVYLKKELSKIDLKIASLREIYNNLGRVDFEKENKINKQINDLKNKKQEIISECYKKYPKAKYMEIKLIEKLKNNLENKELELNKLKVRETLLDQKLSKYTARSKITNLEKFKNNLEKQISLNSKKEKSLQTKLDTIKLELQQTHNKALDKISNDEYSKLIKEANILKKEINAYIDKENNKLFGGLFQSKTHKENLKKYTEISLKIDKIISKKKEYKAVKSELENKLIFQINKMEAVINRFDSQSRGLYSTLRTVNKTLQNLDRQEYAKKGYSVGGYSSANLNSFINLHNKNLGEVLHTGSLRIKTSFEESLEKQMAREMDFSR